MNTDFWILQGPMYRAQTAKAWRRSCSFVVRFTWSSKLQALQVYVFSTWNFSANKTTRDTPDGCGWPWTMYTHEITFFCFEINLNENKYDCLRSGKITKFRVYSDHKTSSFPKLNNFFFHESRHPSVWFGTVHWHASQMENIVHSFETETNGEKNGQWAMRKFFRYWDLDSSSGSNSHWEKESDMNDKLLYNVFIQNEKHETSPPNCMNDNNNCFSSWIGWKLMNHFHQTCMRIINENVKRTKRSTSCVMDIHSYYDVK